VRYAGEQKEVDAAAGVALFRHQEIERQGRHVVGEWLPVGGLLQIEE
jgi:hypothetical protein